MPRQAYTLGGSPSATGSVSSWLRGFLVPVGLVPLEIDGNKRSSTENYHGSEGISPRQTYAVSDTSSGGYSVPSWSQGLVVPVGLVVDGSRRSTTELHHESEGLSPRWRFTRSGSSSAADSVSSLLEGLVMPLERVTFTVVNNTRSYTVSIHPSYRLQHPQRLLISVACVSESFCGAAAVDPLVAAAESAPYYSSTSSLRMQHAVLITLVLGEFLCYSLESIHAQSRGAEVFAGDFAGGSSTVAAVTSALHPSYRQPPRRRHTQWTMATSKGGPTDGLSDGEECGASRSGKSDPGGPAKRSVHPAKVPAQTAGNRDDERGDRRPDDGQGPGGGPPTSVSSVSEAVQCKRCGAWFPDEESLLKHAVTCVAPVESTQPSSALISSSPTASPPPDVPAVSSAPKKRGRPPGAANKRADPVTALRSAPVAAETLPAGIAATGTAVVDTSHPGSDAPMAPPVTNTTGPGSASTTPVSDRRRSLRPQKQLQVSSCIQI